MKDVIVIGKGYSITLGVIRSLGEAGYGVRLLALSDHVARISGSSKYVKQVFQTEKQYDLVLKGMETLRGDDDRILVFPLNDSICMQLDQNAKQLQDHYIIPTLTAYSGGITEFMDKLVQKRAAEQCGLLTARGASYTTDDTGIEQAVEQVAFPCFQKPLASVKSKTGGKTCFAKCSNQEELRKAMQNARAQECDIVLLEEFLAIDKELTAYGVAANSRVYIPACMETLRGGFNDVKGVAAEGVVKSSKCFGETKEKLEEFVRNSGLTGLFCIDVIQSNGKLYFSEMNLRAGGSCYAITLAGVNLPAALADMVYNSSAEGPQDIGREVHFLNEYIEVSTFSQGFTSKKDYKAHMSGATERLIQSTDDPKPWKKFRGMENKIRLMRMLKR